MSISASLVKELRDKTGAGMMECKKALGEAEGNLEKATKILRERGIAKAQKRESRTAAEGLVSIAVSEDKKKAAIVELNCETDFAAKSDDFGHAIKALANTALSAGADSVDALNAAPVHETGKSGAETITDLLTKIGEKMTLSNVAFIEGDLIVGYIHPPGKIGVAVSAKIEGNVDPAKADEAIRDVAMHVAAAAPRFLDRSEVNNEIIEAERDIFANIARKEGKPENIIPKIVDGRIGSFYKDNCLLDQPFVKEPKLTVGKYLEQAGKEAGGSLTISRFVRLRVGDSSGSESNQAGE